MLLLTLMQVLLPGGLILNFKKMCQETLIKGRLYEFQCSTYVQAGNIPRAVNCYAVTATNVGDTIAYVQGMIIYPATTQPGIGNSRQWSGFQNDLYMGNIIITFDTSGGGTNPAVEITQFFYLK